MLHIIIAKKYVKKKAFFEIFVKHPLFPICPHVLILQQNCTLHRLPQT